MLKNNTNRPIQLSDKEKEERVAHAIAFFKEGYNCAQSVVAAYADLYGVPTEQALRMSASFGGGIGRMRQTCGAVCGMFMLAGLDCGTTEAADHKGKNNNYKVVQNLAERFKAENGSLICAELLGLKKPEEDKNLPPKRPCVMMVETAARLFGDYLQQCAALKE